MLTTATDRVGDEEGRRWRKRGRKTAELNWNRNLDRNQGRASDWIPVDLTIIILPNTHRFHRRLFQRRVRRGDVMARSSMGMGRWIAEKPGVGWSQGLEAWVGARVAASNFLSPGLPQTPW